MLNLARQDIVWHSVSDLITDVENKDMQGLNMVEFNAVSPEDIKDKVDTLCRLLDECVQEQTNGIIGYQLTSSKADILKIKTREVMLTIISVTLVLINILFYLIIKKKLKSFCKRISEALQTTSA